MLSTSISFDAYTQQQYPQLTRDGHYYHFPNHPIVVHYLPIPLQSIPLLEQTKHQELVLEYRKKGLHLIHLWEDVWKNKPSIVQSRLNAITGQFTRIHARETKVVKINKPELDAFLNQHHLMGATGGKYKLGLAWNKELVAVASFGKECPVHRKGKVYNSVELIRFCNKVGHTVTGGMSKLIASLVQQVHPDDIMTSVDLDWSNGKAYERLGFELSAIMPQQEVWVHTATMHRYLPHRLPKELQHAQMPEDIDCVRIFNSGNLKYILPL